jgi:hypothetical protein
MAWISRQLGHLKVDYQATGVQVRASTIVQVKPFMYHRTSNRQLSAAAFYKWSQVCYDLLGDRPYQVVLFVIILRWLENVRIDKPASAKPHFVRRRSIRFAVALNYVAVTQTR